MTTSIPVTNDTDVGTIIETVIGTLQQADALGVRFLPARDLYRARYGSAFHEAMRRARNTGRITSRRIRTGNRRRRRYIALPQNSGFLPDGAR